MRARRLLLALTMISCGDPSSQPDASTDLDAADVDAPPPVECEAGASLTMRAHAVRPTDAIPAGRLVIAFYQFSDDVEPYPALVVGFDEPLAAFAPGEARCIDVDLATVTAPTSDDYQLCQRTCFDLTDPACDCPGTPPEPTMAFVLVVRDADDSGAIEPAELLEESNFIGAGYLGVAGSAAAQTPPTWIDPLFPEGVGAGVQPYRVIDTDSFDQLGIHQDGTVYDLNLCPAGDATCELPFPNLT